MQSLPMSSEDAATSSGAEAAVRTCLTQRGYSDSVVSSCRPSSTQTGNTSVYNEAVMKPIQPCTCGDHGPPTSQPAHAGSLSQRVKSRQMLQLPSFRSLGIASSATAGQPQALASGALPTPPEDAFVNNKSFAPLVLGEIPRSISFPEGILPTTPGSFDFPSCSLSKIADKPVPDTSEPSNPATPNANQASTTNFARDFAAADQDTLRAGNGEPDPLGGDNQAGGSDDSVFVTGIIPFTSESTIQSVRTYPSWLTGK